MASRTSSLLLATFITLTMILSTIAQAKELTENTAVTHQAESIILAGGCFWCIESDYEKLDGIINVVSGYSGGTSVNPTYKQVSAGNSGHIEVVQVTYNPQQISHSEILDFFWRHIDPTRNDGQFCDRGPHYRPAIFYKDETEREAILKSAAHIENIKPFKAPLKVEFIQASKFYPAEDYHQDYYKKNPLRYNYYRYSCGRDARIEELWGEK